MDLGEIVKWRFFTETDWLPEADGHNQPNHQEEYEQEDEDPEVVFILVPAVIGDVIVIVVLHDQHLASVTLCSAVRVHSDFMHMNSCHNSSSRNHMGARN